MIFVHAGLLNKPTLCGLRPGLGRTVVKSSLMTNCKNCITRIHGKSLVWTSDGFVLLGSGVFVEKSAKTEMIDGRLWKSENL